MIPIDSSVRKLLSEVNTDREDEIRSQFGCGICFDVGMITEPYEISGRTFQRAKDCECKKVRVRKARFQEAVQRTPKIYREKRGVNNGLDGLKGAAELVGMGIRPHDKYDEVLGMLRKNSDQSFYLFGRTGVHKTTFAWALLQEAGRRGDRVGGNTGKSLIDTLRNYQLEKTVPRDHSFYSLHQLESETARMCVLIDDIDGIVISEYTFSLLWDLMDKVQTYEQQLIITSNLSIDDLIHDWCSRDGSRRANAINYSEKLIRRMKETCIDIDLR